VSGIVNAATSVGESACGADRGERREADELLLEAGRGHDGSCCWHTVGREDSGADAVAGCNAVSVLNRQWNMWRWLYARECQAGWMQQRVCACGIHESERWLGGRMGEGYRR